MHICVHLSFIPVSFVRVHRRIMCIMGRWNVDIGMFTTNPRQVMMLCKPSADILPYGQSESGGFKAYTIVTFCNTLISCAVLLSFYIRRCVLLIKNWRRVGITVRLSQNVSRTVTKAEETKARIIVECEIPFGKGFVCSKCMSIMLTIRKQSRPLFIHLRKNGNGFVHCPAVVVAVCNNPRDISVKMQLPWL